jgi:preprotein translocase subunit SecF
MFSLVEKRRYYFIFSGIIIALGIVAMVISVVRTGSPFLLGVDFRSGTRFEIQFNQPVTEDAIAQVFAQAGYPGVSIIGLQGEGLENAWQARTLFMTPEEAQAIERQLDAMSPLRPGTTQVQSVSPSVGEEVTRAADYSRYRGRADGVGLYHVCLPAGSQPLPLRGLCRDSHAA